MKLKLTILFLAIASMAMAQKKEIRKIEKAIDKGEFSKAQEIFQSIDEKAVEEEYAASYYFYKAANYMDLSGATKTSFENLRAAEVSLQKAEGLGFENPMLQPLVKNMIDVRKFEIANEKVASGDIEMALMLVEELYKNDPNNLIMLYNAGELAYSNSMFDKAIEKYSMLLDKKYTGQVSTYVATNKEGVVEKFSNMKLRDYAVKAGTHFNPAIETSPSILGEIVLKTVWLYNNSGDKKKAKEVYEIALENFPEDDSLKLVKPDIYLTLGMTEEYKEAVENMNSEVTDPRVFDNLGDAAMKDKNYDVAMRYFESSIKLDPNNYFALVNLANSNLEKGNLENTTAEDQKSLYSKAVVNLEKAHKVKPEEKGVIATLVSLYDFLGMNEKSAEMKAKM